MTELAQHDVTSARHPRSSARRPDELVTKNVVDRAFELGRSRGTPWNVHAEWLAEDRLDDDRLVAAAAATMHEHPLLSARHGTRDQWIVPAQAAPPVVDISTATKTAVVARLRNRAVSHRFDLRSQPPVRFELLRAAEGDHVLVVADHALVDGVGIARTALSLMAAYAEGRGAGTRAGLRTGERDSRWSDAHDLAVAFPPPDQVRAVVDELAGRARPTAVRLAPDRLGDEPGCGVVYGQLSAATTAALRSLPRGPSTANDVVVAAFCQAGMRWNRRAGRRPVPFTVGVPLNLRPARAWFDGVCNATLAWPVRIDAAPGEVPSPLAVLRQVSDQLRPVRSGIYTTPVRAVLAHLGTRRWLSVRERHALATTTVVTTVPGSDVAQAGLPAPLSTATFYGGAPAPPVMGMTFGVIPGNGPWRLSARYVRARHTAVGAARFLSWADAAVTEICDQLSSPATALEVTL